MQLVLSSITQKDSLQVSSKLVAAMQLRKWQVTVTHNKTNASGNVSKLLYDHEK